MEQLLISIVIPTCNSFEKFDKCLKSCLNQSYQRFEIIIVDDGSSNEFRDILAAYETGSPKIKVIYQTQHGAAHARNIGLISLKGDYVIFVDSDDIPAPNLLEVLFERIHIANADMAICSYDTITKTRNRVRKQAFRIKNHVYNGKCAGLSLLKDSYTPTLWNKLFKTEFLKKNDILFQENIYSGHDLIFSLNAIIKANKILTISVPLYSYYVRNDSLSNKITKRHIIGYRSLFTAIKQLNKATQKNCNRYNKEIIVYRDKFYANLLLMLKNTGQSEYVKTVRKIYQETI